MKVRRQTDLGAGLVVYLRPFDRQQLRERLRQEGIYSVSGWFRGLALQKLREGAQEGAGHDIDQH
jgi:hypothetical protein